MAGTFNPGGLNTPPTSIVNCFSAGGAAAVPLTPSVFKSILSGDLDAATYPGTAQLVIADSGVLNICGGYSVDATSRTIGVKVVVDGVTVFDASCAANTTIGSGVLAVGFFATGSLVAAPIAFNSSLAIYLKQSLDETDKVGLVVDYHLT